MRFLLAGGYGFLGRSLRDHLARQGHEVTRLVRGEPASPDESRWDPQGGEVDPAAVDAADVVVNLAGASFVRWPFTESYRREFHDSRVRSTATLAEAVARSERKPALLAQNGTSVYGDRGEEILTEDVPTGDDGTFLNGITKPWQAATEPAAAAGARVCVLRTSFVLDAAGGSFRPLLLMFRAGLGGPAGDGSQYFSTISLQDWVRAATFLATHDSCEGPYNLTGPNPTTNREFVETLGRLLHRPTVVRVPEKPLRLLFPELAPELFSSVRAVPARLEAAGFDFEDRTVNERLASALTPR
jgi:uncharacterized protein (TIGR01777 family)